MSSSPSKPPVPVGRAVVGLCLLSVLALVLGVLGVIAVGWQGQGAGCIGWAVLFVVLTVPGLYRGHRGPWILAICGGVLAVLTGLSSVRLAASAPVSLVLNAAMIVLGLVLVVLGAAVIWCLVGPKESREWFRPE